MQTVSNKNIKYVHSPISSWTKSMSKHWSQLSLLHIWATTIGPSYSQNEKARLFSLSCFFLLHRVVLWVDKIAKQKSSEVVYSPRRVNVSIIISVDIVCFGDISEPSSIDYLSNIPRTHRRLNIAAIHSTHLTGRPNLPCRSRRWVPLHSYRPLNIHFRSNMRHSLHTWVHLT